MGDAPLIELVAGSARAVIDPERGGRLTRLSVAGHEVVWDGSSPDGVNAAFYGGSFPMAPFAGRLSARQLDDIGAAGPDGGAAASHGLVHSVVWDVTECTGTSAELHTRIDDGWTAPATLRQCYLLEPAALTIRLELNPDRRMPAALGFHPWFVRDLGGGPVSLTVQAAGALGFGDTGEVTREVVPVPDADLDHFLIGVAEAPLLRWPELDLRIEANTTTWILYDRPAWGLCVEPVTAPPVNLETDTGVEPGAPLVLEMRLRWALNDEAGGGS